MNEKGKALRRGMMALRLEVDPMIVESLMVLAREAIDEACQAGLRAGTVAIHPRCGRPCRAADTGKREDCTCGCDRPGSGEGRGDAVTARSEAIERFVQDFADEPCVYRDNCPPFGGARHGTCLPCRARQALSQPAPHDPKEEA